MTVARALWLFSVFIGAGFAFFLTFVLFPQRRVKPAGALVWLTCLAFNVHALAALFVGFLEPAIERAAVHPAVLIAFALAFAGSCGVTWLAARDRQVAFALLFLASVISIPLTRGYTEILPLLVLACFLYWPHTFGLYLSRRAVFALTLGVASAVYLFAVRHLSGFLESKFQVLGPVIEAALLFSAGVLWLPLYAWLSRALTQRAAEYAGFAKSVLEGAARILDLDARMRFFVDQLAQRFKLRQVILRYRDRSVSLNSESTCNHVFPFPEGALLVDTRPLPSLDDNEPILEALAAQIGQSLDACRIAEEKIHLERLAVLGNAAAAIAHEVKNPLSAIKTIARVMQEDPAVAAQYDQDLGFILSETDRLDRSVRQLLGFARTPPPLNEDVDVSTLLSAAVHALSRQAAGCEITLSPRIEPGLTLRNASRELLQQIVWNAILNAIQASSPHQSILIVAERAGSALRIAVTDQGPGIPNDLREKVFEPFFTTKPQGTGLGLAIIRRNARLLGGDAVFQSGQTTGACLVITLPQP